MSVVPVGHEFGGGLTKVGLAWPLPDGCRQLSRGTAGSEDSPGLGVPAGALGRWQLVLAADWGLSGHRHPERRQGLLHAARAFLECDLRETSEILDG